MVVHLHMFRVWGETKNKTYFINAATCYTAHPLPPHLQSGTKKINAHALHVGIHIVGTYIIIILFRSMKTILQQEQHLLKNIVSHKHNVLA